MKEIVVLLSGVLALAACGSHSTSEPVATSPDGRIKVSVQTEGGQLSYSISQDSESLIVPSKLGFELMGGNILGDNTEILSVTHSSHKETWETVWGESRLIEDNHNSMIVHTAHLDVEFRVFNDGVGFRYIFPDDLGEFRIREELTEYKFARADHKIWWMPRSEPYYEAYGNHTAFDEIDCAYTPVTITGADGRFYSIHEAALLDFAKVNLVGSDASTLKTSLTKWSDGTGVYVTDTRTTPWRTIIITDRAGGLIESHLMLNLNEPCKIEDTSWIHPTKYCGVWWNMIVGTKTWSYTNDLPSVRLGQTDYKKCKPNGTHGATNEEVKRYIDFAAKNGLQEVLVEGWNEGWEDWFGHQKLDVFDFVTPYPDFDIKALNEYAHSKGVKLMMHHETSASTLNYERHMEKAFELMNKYGYDAVKTGYVGDIIPRGEYHYSQLTNNHYQRVIETAAKHHIMVNAHEATRPTGICRTWPNLVGNESARGTEYEAFGGSVPYHTVMLPFTRLQGGPMDYTPGIFETKLSEWSSNTSFVHTTLCGQLSLYLVMYSPLQMAADLPEHYEKYDDAFQFIRDVACDWDDSKYLEAEPAKYITVARKAKGTDNWFVGGKTDAEARTAVVRLDFLDKGRKYDCAIYQDGKDADYERNPKAYQIIHKTVKRGDVLKIKEARGGGFAISLMAK